MCNPWLLATHGCCRQVPSTRAKPMVRGKWDTLAPVGQQWCSGASTSPDYMWLLHCHCMWCGTLLRCHQAAPRLGEQDRCCQWGRAGTPWAVGAGHTHCAPHHVSCSRTRPIQRPELPKAVLQQAAIRSPREEPCSVPLCAPHSTAVSHRAARTQAQQSSGPHSSCPAGAQARGRSKS